MEYVPIVIRRYQHWTLCLHDNQSYLGRCFLTLHRDGDIDPFIDATEEEREELRHIIANYLEPALWRLFRPLRLNYDNLRNTYVHCHWHVVPRYDGPRQFAGIEFTDKNQGKNWSPYDKAFTVPPAVLEEIRAALAIEVAHPRCVTPGCRERAAWVRSHQFSKDFPLCAAHAEADPEFGENDNSHFVWAKLKDGLMRMHIPVIVQSPPSTASSRTSVVVLVPPNPTAWETDEALEPVLAHYRADVPGCTVRRAY